MVLYLAIQNFKIEQVEFESSPIFPNTSCANLKTASPLAFVVYEVWKMLSFHSSGVVLKSDIINRNTQKNMTSSLSSKEDA